MAKKLVIPVLGLAVLMLVAIGPLGSASAAPGPTDLVLTKTDSPDPVTKGGDVTYTINVQNVGPNDATSVVVTDTLPDDLVDFRSASGTQGTCSQAGGIVTCDLGTLLAGGSATATIVVKAAKTGTATNTATVGFAEGDTNPVNNTDAESTQILAATTTGKGKKKKVKASCTTPTIVGTAGNDTIVGTPAGDIIVGLTGDDVVFALGGNDIICLGPNSDRGFGGAGLDAIIGGRGFDLLSGGSGRDVLKGNRGRDRLRGGFGADALNGGLNRDRCRGGPARDTLARCP